MEYQSNIFQVFLLKRSKLENNRVLNKWLLKRHSSIYPYFNKKIYFDIKHNKRINVLHLLYHNTYLF